MIDDLEMQQLFKIESDDHLQLLTEGLLQLETAPDDQKVLEAVFREAHSLKGAARMLGLRDIEKVSHRFEDILGQAKKGEITLSSEIIDIMCACLDVIRKLADEALTGNPSGVDVQEVLSLLNTDTPARCAPVEQPAPAKVECAVKSGSQKAELSDNHTTVTAAPPTPVPDPPPLQTGSESFRIETIRVETWKLDQLMTLAGELTVTKNKFIQRHGDIEELLDSWELFYADIADLYRRNPVMGTGVNHLSALVEKLRKHSYYDNSRLESVAMELKDSIRSIRLIPLSTVFNLFPRMVRDLTRDGKKEAQLIIEGGETFADKHLVEEIKDPLMHIIRNAIDHGLESPEERVRNGKPRMGTVLLKASQTETNIMIEVVDDGRGLDMEKIRLTAKKMKFCQDAELNAMSRERLYSLIFLPGFSTSSFVSDVSGRGVGLDAVHVNVERLKGTVTVESSPGEGCTSGCNSP